MKFSLLKFVSVALLAGALLALPAGCHRGTLAPGGVYAPYATNAATGEVTSTPDNTLYSTDLSINTAKSVIQSFLQWELSNRPLVQAQWPDVTTYAKKLSNDAPKWLQSAVRLRDAYKANPTAENKTAFDQAMAVLDQAVSEAQRYLAQSVKTR